MAVKLPAFKDEARYRIELSSSAQYKDQVFKPANSYTVKGKIAKTIKPSIASAELVEDEPDIEPVAERETEA